MSKDEFEMYLSEEEQRAFRWVEQILDYKVNVYCADEIARTLLKSFEELEQYRAIGTVDECREAVEKINR